MKKINFKIVVSRYWFILLILLSIAIFFLIAIRIANSSTFPNKDFFTFWLAGRLAISGQNPYLANIWIGGHHQYGITWIPNTTFIYPLPLSLLFAPFGLLTLYQAFICWVMLSQFMIVLSGALLLRLSGNHIRKQFILPLLAGVVLFRPTIITLINGQLSGLLLLVISCIVVLWEKRKWWEGSLLLPILALKPNLGIPIILLLSFYLVCRKQFSSLASEGLSGLLILLVGFTQNPYWLTEFWEAGNNKLSQTFGFSPTIWGMSALVCKYDLSCTISYGVCAGLLLLIGLLFLVMTKRKILSPILAASLAVTITLLLTPYTWPYDQLLLVVPIIAVSIGLAKEGYRYLPVALIFLIVDIMTIVLLAISAKYQMEIWNAVIPFSILCLLIWYILKKTKVPQEIEIG